MDEISKYDLLQCMATRRRELEIIEKGIAVFEQKIKELKQQREHTQTLLKLDEILLKEIENK